MEEHEYPYVEERFTSPPCQPLTRDRFVWTFFSFFSKFYIALLASRIPLRIKASRPSNVAKSTSFVNSDQQWRCSFKRRSSKCHENTTRFVCHINSTLRLRLHARNARTMNLKWDLRGEIFSHFLPFFLSTTMLQVNLQILIINYSEFKNYENFANWFGKKLNKIIRKIIIRCRYNVKSLIEKKSFCILLLYTKFYNIF